MSNGLPSVAIVGGGIGGLTSALALADVGITSIVLERHVGSNDVGAGIQLSPNATRILFQLGLKKDLTTLSRSPSSMEWLDGITDKPLARFPIAEFINETFGAPYLQIYRPDLMRVLQAKCGDEPRIELRSGASVEKLKFDADGIILGTESGDVHSDLCIGADGTNSTIRKYANDSIEKRLFGGFAYRAVIPLDQLDERYPPAMTRLWLTSAYHVVTYTVGEKPLLNCVFVVESNDSAASEDLHRQRTTRQSLTEAISTPSPLLRFLLERVPEETLFRWPLYQFPPVRVHSALEHPVALVGDAWHTTLPFAGQGAALAIEDASALATCLSDSTPSSLVTPLTRYEESRISRIRQVQAISARNRIVYHLENPILRLFRSWGANAAYRRTARQLFSYKGIQSN